MKATPPQTSPLAAPTVHPEPGRTKASGPGTPTPIPDLLTHTLMTEALQHEHAQPLAPLITDFVCYHEQWWITSPDGWLRITDPDLTRTLDRQHQRFTQGLF